MELDHKQIIVPGHFEVSHHCNRIPRRPGAEHPSSLTLMPQNFALVKMGILEAIIKPLLQKYLGAGPRVRRVKVRFRLDS